MKILYACYGKAGLDCLYHLLNQKECSPANIFAVTYAGEENRALCDALAALNVKYTTEPINDAGVIKEIKKFAPDFLFSIYFRDIIGKEALGAVAKASVNLHPSLLPDYKGCFSAPWVLINGEKKAGVTYHLIDDGVDTGPIILQKEIAVNAWDTAFSLYHRLAATGAEAFSEMFGLLARNGFRGAPQKEGGRRYKRKIPHDGLISLEWGREKIHRFIRAMFFPPYRGAMLRHDGVETEFRSTEEFDDFCKNKGIKVT